jgi:hypothetical protein
MAWSGNAWENHSWESTTAGSSWNDQSSLQTAAASAANAASTTGWEPQQRVMKMSTETQQAFLETHKKLYFVSTLPYKRPEPQHKSYRRLADHYVLEFQEDRKIIMYDPWGGSTNPVGYWAVSAAPEFREIMVEILLREETNTSTYRMRRVLNTNTWLTSFADEKEQFLLCDFV